MKKRHFIFSVFLTFSFTLVMAQVQGLFTCKVGDYEVILLSDGAGQGNAALLIGATPEKIQQTMPDSTYSTAINYFLVKADGKNYLIDTGLGNSLAENLYRAGVSPDEIQTILLTHLHGDHIGGLLKEGNKVFPNAVIRLSEAEKDYWTNDIALSLASDNGRKSFFSVRRMLQAYEPQTEVFIPMKAELPEGDGFFFIEAYGHTPGHTAVLLQSKGERLLIWGDLIHATAIQMPYPEVALTYDVDPELAVRTRQEILKFAAGNQIPVAGMHIPYPAVGTLETNAENGYRFIPAK